MDYKEQIEELRALSKHVPEQMCWYDGKDPIEKAADTIETLLAERDAAIADIFQSSNSPCNVCKYLPDDFSTICFSCTQTGGLNNNWQWRGPQKHD